ncbi:MAG: outer membrane beta-barrel protein [Candidatus Pacebacteria bacterium]|nr:outer membrane beta-barrel protein [Candidatus Paceibacterota bacterium]
MQNRQNLHIWSHGCTAGQLGLFFTNGLRFATLALGFLAILWPLIAARAALAQTLTPTPKVIQTEVLDPNGSGKMTNPVQLPAAAAGGGELLQPAPPPPASMAPKPLEATRPMATPASSAAAKSPIIAPKSTNQYLRANLGLTSTMLLGSQPISDIGTYGTWSEDPQLGKSVLFGVAYGRSYNSYLSLEGDFRYRSSAEFRSVSQTSTKTVTTVMNLSFMTFAMTGLFHLPEYDTTEYSPYLAISGGASIVDSSKPQITTRTSATSSSSKDGKVPDGGLAWIWGVGAGIDYKISDVISLNLDYRFTNLRFQIVPEQTQSPLDLYTNDFSLGLKYRF